MKLLIVGNGFDLAHGFETRYDNFKEWLESNYDVDHDTAIINLPEYNTNYKGMDEYDDDEMANFFYKLIYDAQGEKWSDFESALAELDWGSRLDESCEYLFDDEDDEDKAFKYKRYSYEDAAQLSQEIAFILPERFFRKWVKEIDISNPKYISNELRKLFDSKRDKIISFNYTDTLESHYGMSDVLHIHGRASQSSELVVGHGSKYEYPEEEEEDTDFSHLKNGCSTAILEFYRKPVETLYDVDTAPYIRRGKPLYFMFFRLKGLVISLYRSIPQG